ncbi:MAG: recombinase family protein [Magnetospirillum sp.]|nr:MAG: recombinase family protein [Magnetospirillum sp.]
MRAAIYARNSSDRQSENSIEDQVRLCRELAERHGLEVTKTYTDYALSGASMNRPGLKALIEDSQARAFEVVISEALDRLSRDRNTPPAFTSGWSMPASRSAP